jgi:hypothetical protein
LNDESSSVSFMFADRLAATTMPAPPAKAAAAESPVVKDFEGFPRRARVAAPGARRFS